MYYIAEEVRRRALRNKIGDLIDFWAFMRHRCFQGEAKQSNTKRNMCGGPAKAEGWRSRSDRTAREHSAAGLPAAWSR